MAAKKAKKSAATKVKAKPKPAPKPAPKKAVKSSKPIAKRTGKTGKTPPPRTGKTPPPRTGKTPPPPVSEQKLRGRGATPVPSRVQRLPPSAPEAREGISPVAAKALPP